MESGDPQGYYAVIGLLPSGETVVADVTLSTTSQRADGEGRETVPTGEWVNPPDLLRRNRSVEVLPNTQTVKLTCRCNR